MNKINKGALAMVLAGSVTFSVISGLLTDQSSQRAAEENALTISEDQQKADVINQAEQTVNEQTPTTNVKDAQPELSHNISAFQAETQRNNEELTKATAINSANTNTTATTTPAAPTPVAASTEAPKTTANTIPAATGTNPTSGTTTTVPATTATNTANETTTPATTTTAATTTNHGQQISQAAKEKAASRQDKKENNGKKI